MQVNLCCNSKIGYLQPDEVVYFYILLVNYLKNSIQGLKFLNILYIIYTKILWFIEKRL